jgi:hypothetical protein
MISLDISKNYNFQFVIQKLNFQVMAQFILERIKYTFNLSLHLIYKLILTNEQKLNNKHI